MKYGLGLVLGDQWNIEEDTINNPDRFAQKKYLIEHGTFQGRLLREHGLWDTLAHVLTKPALDFIREEGTFYHYLHGNPNAANQALFMLDMLATMNCGLVTIQGGTETIMHHMLKTIPAASIHLSTTITHLAEKSDGVDTSLTLFANNHEIRCNAAVLACPQNALKRISGLPARALPLLNSVMTVNLFKIFVVLADPPWNEYTLPAPNSLASKAPCREIHFGYNKNNKTGSVLIYGDEPTLNYWSPFARMYLYVCTCM
jgi:hypothetical protein